MTGWAVRRRISGPIRRSLLDLLFWLCTTAALFLWSVRAGGGVVQVSVCAALLLGTVGYLRVLLRSAGMPLMRLSAFLSSILHLIGAPFRLFCRLGSKSINF